MKIKFKILTIITSIITLISCTQFLIAEPQHGIAMHGKPFYKAGFHHLSYANPDAPKSGIAHLSSLGTFDSLNPFIVKGRSPSALKYHMYESLMARAYDEPFSLYGLVAETIETPDDRSWVEFKIRTQARFSDDMPITTDDIKFSIDILRAKGLPKYDLYFTKVAKIIVKDKYTIRFELNDKADRELPLILGLMPILPKHYYQTHEFDKTSFDIPIGSGPYLIEKVEPGKQIVFKLNENYWGKNLALNKGRHNFKTIIYDYYRDVNSRFEAFKKGLIDIYADGDPAHWKNSYNFPAIHNGKIQKEQFLPKTPTGMFALSFNLRRDKFKDQNIRKALSLMLNFDWMNKNFFYGANARTQSYFYRSNLSAIENPANEFEIELLKDYKHLIPQNVMDGTFRLSANNATGKTSRKTLRHAINLFRQAGYSLKEGKMISDMTGKQYSFEIMVRIKDHEKIALNYQNSLKEIGVDVKVRLVDSSQYMSLRQNFDYDMIPSFWFASLSPGNEQSLYWGSKAADQVGSRNYPGIKEPAIDYLIDKLVSTHSYDNLSYICRAIDRMLISGNYFIPLFYLPYQYVASSSKMKHPDSHTLFGYNTDSWWIEE